MSTRRVISLVCLLALVQSSSRPIHSADDITQHPARIDRKRTIEERGKVDYLSSTTPTQSNDILKVAGSTRITTELKNLLDPIDGVVPVAPASVRGAVQPVAQVPRLTIDERAGLEALYSGKFQRAFIAFVRAHAFAIRDPLPRAGMVAALRRMGRVSETERWLQSPIGFKSADPARQKVIERLLAIPPSPAAIAPAVATPKANDFEFDPR